MKLLSMKSPIWTIFRKEVLENLRDRFPEVAWIPGYWIEYGMAAEPSAFGARINWHGNQPPSIEPVRGGLNVLFDVEAPDPQHHGPDPRGRR